PFLKVRVLRADRVRADVDAEDSLLRGPFSAEDPTLDLCNGKFDTWRAVVADLAGSTGATHDRLFALAVEQNIDRACCNARATVHADPLVQNVREQMPEN